jgi:hypothetical protein
MSGDFKRCNFQSYALQWHLAVNAKVDNEVCSTHRKCSELPGAAAAAAMKI